MTRWVKEPAPGHVRGKGEWAELEQFCAGHSAVEATWRCLRATRYLPTREQPERPEASES